MNEIPFHLTKMGRQYYDVTMPELVRQLHRMNDMFALYVELREKQPCPKRCEKSDGEKG